MKKLTARLTLTLLLSCLFSPALFASKQVSQSSFSAMNAVGNPSSERRGTENWEQPQGNFFVVPAIIMGIVVIILFYNRD